MSIWSKFSAWFSGWPESTIQGQKLKKDKELFREEEARNQKPYLMGMTKKQLEKYGRTLGVELDRRKTKKKLIEIIENSEGYTKFGS